jgi:polysaccharide chain length determinant protein (PEP-CTERM system associated)
MHFLVEIRRYAAAGWRHRWKALALAWLVCLGGWAYVYSLPNQYRTSGRIYADADAILGQLLRGIAVDSTPASHVDLLQRTLLSRPNLERVAARTGLDLRASTAAARDQLLNDLARSIRLSSQGRNLFTIAYSDTNPRMTHDAVQALLTLFMEQATASDRERMENARTFVNQQIAAYETQLREAEQRRADFRARYVDLLPSETAGASRLEQGRTRLQTLRGELMDATARRDMLRRQLGATPAMLPASQVAGSGESRLAEAERQLRELRLRYTEQHPEVIATRNIIAELRRSGPMPGSGRSSRAASGPQLANPAHEQLRSRLLDSEGQVQSLERQVQEEVERIDRLEALARTAPQLHAQFQNLDRDYNVLLRSYQELLARRESVQLAGAARNGAERVRLEVVDPPLMPVAPVGPNRLLLASAVLAVGLGAGVALAFLLIQFDRSFYTVHDLRKLGLPVIGGISAIDQQPGAAVRTAAFAGCVGMLLVVYGAVAVGGALMTRLPALAARLMA